MRDQPFAKVPYRKLLQKLAVPLLSIFLLTCLTMGFVATSIEAKSHSREPSAVLPPFAMALDQYRRLNFELAHVPEVCWNSSDGDSVQTFRKKQCDEYWDDVYTHAKLAALPPLLIAVLIFFAFDSILLLYRRVQKRIDSGRPTLRGVVTDPPELKNDVYGYLLNFRSVSIELSDRTQIRVYMPTSVAPPLPGDKLDIYDAGKHWGGRRFLALLHAPHVAIVSGVHQS